MSGASRPARIDAATAAFRQATGRAPVWAAFVPGRLEVFGKHTDYAGGRSLVAATCRGFGVVAAPRRDALVRVIDAAGGQTRVRPGSDTGQTRVKPVSDPGLTPV